MAVNGTGIAIGQKWKTRGGEEVEIVNNDGHRVYPWDLSNGVSVTEQGAVLCIREDEFDLITLIQDEHGFIPWNGGACPVGEGVRIEYKMRSNPKIVFEGFPTGLRWNHIGLNGDIIAYRVVKQEANPTKTEAKEEPMYTIKQVFEAINRVTTGTVHMDEIVLVEKELAKTQDPDYKLYLELKARFE